MKAKLELILLNVSLRLVLVMARIFAFWFRRRMGISKEVWDQKIANTDPSAIAAAVAYNRPWPGRRPSREWGDESPTYQQSVPGEFRDGS